MRLQVFLSHNGVCSRRDAMDVIKAGRVTVNGLKVTEPSFAVFGREEIMADGKRVNLKEYTYVIVNKPAGYTTTKDDGHAACTVMDLLPRSLRHVSPVGRLDRDSEGLLLLTNDGALGFKLTHPKFHTEKMYLVRVNGNLNREKQAKLQAGVVMGEAKTAPCRILDVKYNDKETEFKIILHEGRKRQIRMMARCVGQHVTYLCRLSIGKLRLGNLPKGQWRMLSQQEVLSLTAR